MAKAKRKISPALKWIITEAKKLRRKDHSRKEWKNYVAQASAIYAKKHHGKSPVGKKSHAGRKRKPGRKKVSAVKFIERGETKNTKPKRTVRVNRTHKGTYKSFSTVTGTSDYNHVVLQKVSSANTSLHEAELRLDRLKEHWKKMPKGTGKNLMKRSVKDQQRLISQIKKEIRGFRSLLK